MSSESFRLSFKLEEEDIAYFRSRFRAARRAARESDRAEILKGARQLVAEIRETPRVPAFVARAVDSIEDLTEIVVDAEYKEAMSDSDQDSDIELELPDDVPDGDAEILGADVPDDGKGSRLTEKKENPPGSVSS